MTVVALNGTGMMTSLDGTMPLRPFHPDGFIGTLQADGQQVRVAALACDDERMIAISLVGFDTSIGVVLARFWSSTLVAFTPGNAWQEAWQGPGQLKRSIERYKQCVAHLEGTRQVNALALVRTAHLTEGILHPPDLPEMREKLSEETDQARGRASSTTQAKPPAWVPRYILGNWDENGPNKQSFLGHLYALRVLFLHRHSEHPDWLDVWAQALWEQGLQSELISPISALGLHAWRISGDLMAWSALVGVGVREGWLPWREDQSR
jgi:hypothetical protein